MKQIIKCSKLIWFFQDILRIVFLFTKKNDKKYLRQPIYRSFYFSILLFFLECFNVHMINTRRKKTVKLNPFFIEYKKLCNSYSK